MSDSRQALLNAFNQPMTEILPRLTSQGSRTIAWILASKNIITADERDEVCQEGIIATTAAQRLMAHFQRKISLDSLKVFHQILKNELCATDLAALIEPLIKTLSGPNKEHLPQRLASNVMPSITLPPQDAGQSQRNSTRKNNRYEMQCLPHGKCVILNNGVFMKGFPCCCMGIDYANNRDGSYLDVARLRETFGKLKYDVETHEHKKASDMKKTLELYSNDNHTEYDSFICCILSHGDRDVVLGTDSKEVPITDLTSLFEADKCRTLIGKPKLFFIQACRGHKEDSGAFVDLVATDGHTNSGLNGGVDNRCKIPVQSDFSIYYSSGIGYVSYRYPADGSPFIETLCNVLTNDSPRDDLLSMLTTVNNKMKHKDIGDMKQMPELHHRLADKVYFLP